MTHGAAFLGWCIEHRTAQAVEIFAITRYYTNTMKQLFFYHRTKPKGRAMDHIDVHDLPEEEARLIATFVEFLRCRKQVTTQQEIQETEALTPLAHFAVWPLGVKGTLSREDI
jgi:hypothetical protein